MRDAFSMSTLATFCNLFAGFSAALLAMDGDYARAAVLIGVAAVFDALDGAIARRSDRESRFGANLDSLADMVSFGAAPALAVYGSTLEGTGMPGVVVPAIYVLCGAFRLARFPLVKDGGRFVGLPIPPAGVAVAALSAASPSPPVALAALTVLSVLMVSAIPFPTVSSVLTGRKRRDAEEKSAD